MSDEELIEKDLADLEHYLKAGYLGALRSDGNSITDTAATIFSDYVMMRVKHLLKMRDASRDQQIALEARIDELESRLKVQFIPSHWQRLCGEVNSWAKYVDRRLATLKAKQEKEQ